MTEPDASTPPAPDVGRLVAGRYRLAETVGVGGMATVHRALDTKNERDVAVKLLRREVVADADIAMRFRREALAATVLRHPNIVACLETGTDDSQPFLVMELIEGEDLTARLRRAGRLAPTEAARIGLDVARALGVAHIRGIVHRDVKPGNILLARDGRAMVTDFGIARLSADAEGSIPGTTLGSVHYFSPEQAMGATTTAASDVYSLGLVLYEALTGRRAWSGETTALLASSRIGAAAPSPRAVRPELPAALDAIVVRALDADPGRRYPNGNAMATALEQVVSRPDPGSPTVATDTAALAAGAALATAGTASGHPASTGGRMPPTGPVVGPPRARAPLAAVRRAPPAIAAPLIVLLVVLAVVAGALGVAMMSGGDTGLAAIASPTATPTASPTPSPNPTPTAAPTPTKAPKPTLVPKATATSAAGRTADTCAPILGLSCGLDPGAYAPTSFHPAIRFTIGKGWSVGASDPGLLALIRDEGRLTFVSGITAVFPAGHQTTPRSARALVEAFVETDGVAAGKPKDVKINKVKATVVDLAPTGPDRVALFGREAQTFYLEPGVTTRMVVLDGAGGPLVLAIEPAGDTTLETLLPIATPIVNSVRFA